MNIPQLPRLLKIWMPVVEQVPVLAHDHASHPQTHSHLSL
jgi:hypothetical protein